MWVISSKGRCDNSQIYLCFLASNENCAFDSTTVYLESLNFCRSCHLPDMELQRQRPGSHWNLDNGHKNYKHIYDNNSTKTKSIAAARYSKVFITDFKT